MRGRTDTPYIRKTDMIAAICVGVEVKDGSA